MPNRYDPWNRGARNFRTWYNAVRLWDLGTGELLAVMTGHCNRVRSVAFSPDGTRIASSSQDQTVRVWDAAGGKPVAVLQGHTSHVIQVLFSPDGTRVVSASNDGTVRFWDMAQALGGQSSARDRTRGN